MNIKKKIPLNFLNKSCLKQFRIDIYLYVLLMIVIEQNKIKHKICKTAL